MYKTGQVLDLGPLRTKIHIRQTAADTGGRLFETEWELGPQTGGTPVHTHPKALETFAVVQGELEIYMHGAWQTLTAGETAAIEPGVPHTLRNSSAAETRVIMGFQPALHYEEYFHQLAKVVNSGVVQSEDMTFKAMLHLAMLMTSYPDEIRAVKPPAGLMRLFATMGKLLGYRV